MITHQPSDPASIALVRLSEWIDQGNAGRDPEAVTWGRLAKLTEESGEVIAAFIGATGQNPRKGVTHTIADVGDELLDVAITALGAYEHLTQHQGLALGRLDEKIHAVARRAAPREHLLVPAPGPAADPTSVRVIDTITGDVLWEHDLTGRPLIEYVPAEAFRDQDAGRVRIETV